MNYNSAVYNIYILMSVFQKTNLCGVLFQILSIFLTSLMAIINKELGGALNIFQVFFLCSAFSLAILIVVLKFKNVCLWETIRTVDKTYFCSAFLNFISICTFLYSIRIIDLNVFTALTYLKPLFIILLASTFLQEKLTAKCLAAIGIGILGAYIVIQPEISTLEKVVGVSCAFIPTINWAIYEVLIKKQISRDHWTKQSFLTKFLSTLISLPFGLYTWHSVNLNQLAMFSLLGVLSVLSSLSFLYALVRTPLVWLAPIEFVRLIFVSILSYLFFGERLALNTVIGSLFIITSVIIVVQHNWGGGGKQKNK